MNTLIGALTAALILFLSSLVTLFTNDPSLEFERISTAVWVSIGGGAAIAFLKDYQSITARRFINKATRSGDGGGQV
jgi:hypothetical protein